MGLIETGGLMVEVTKVFSFIRGIYDGFPMVVKLVIFGVFGSVIFVALLRSVGR